MKWKPAVLSVERLPSPNAFDLQYGYIRVFGKSCNALFSLDAKLNLNHGRSTRTLLECRISGHTLDLLHQRLDLKKIQVTCMYIKLEKHGTKVQVSGGQESQLYFLWLLSSD